MKYACIQQYFDNGKVRAFVQPADDERINEYKETVDYDLYIDIFDSREEAEDCAKLARKA